MYSKSGCGRCNYVKKAFKDRKVKYTLLKTSKNDVNNEMWRLLKKKKVKGSVMMPVVLVDNKLYYNIKNLEGFVKRITKE